MKSTLLGPCAAVIWTPTHRTFFLCFASGTGAETRLIRGGSLILVAWPVGLMQLANESPVPHSGTSALARLPGIRGRMIVLRPCQKLRTRLRGWHPQPAWSAWSVFIRSRSASPRSRVK